MRLFTQQSSCATFVQTPKCPDKHRFACIRHRKVPVFDTTLPTPRRTNHSVGSYRGKRSHRLNRFSPYADTENRVVRVARNNRNYTCYLTAIRCGCVSFVRTLKTPKNHGILTPKYPVHTPFCTAVTHLNHVQCAFQKSTRSARITVDDGVTEQPRRWGRNGRQV